MLHRSIYLVVAVLCFQPTFARAVHTEQRFYSVLVDGKEAGQAKLTVVEEDDNSAYVTVSAGVKVNGIINYSLQVDTQEWWKEGKLVGMKSFAQENSKKREILVTQDATALRVRLNGMDRVARPDVWTTSFWKLADSKYHNKPIAILSVDHGEERIAQLQFIGNERLPISNVPTACYHFRVTGGGNPIDLWFDQHHRLVRQEFTEAGHRTIIQLTTKR